jgi:hypothetical protein
MAGTSQHALANIGQGAMAGVADWQAATKDLKKADRERRKEFALIEQATRAEQRGDIEREERLLDAARNRGITALQATTSAIQNAYGLDRREALGVAEANFGAGVRATLTREELAARAREGAADRANRLQVANVQASAAGARAAARPDIPAGVRAKIASDVREMRPAIEAQVLASMNLRKPPTDPTALGSFQQRVQAVLQQQYNEELARIAGVDVSAGAGQATNPFEGFSVVGTSR